MKIPDALFHYTIGPKLSKVALSGRLLPANIGTPFPDKEKPVLWWSANSSWEPTATKLLTMDGGRTVIRPTLEILNRDFGAYRFRLDTRNPRALHEVGLKLLPWARMGLAARISADCVARMVAAGLDMGAKPIDWWGCLEAVPTSLEVSGLLRLERLMGPTWVAVEGGLSREVQRLASRQPDPTTASTGAPS